MNDSEFQKFRYSFESALLKAHKSILWLECFDYAFIVEMIENICANGSLGLTQKKIKVWNNADGFVRYFNGKKIATFKKDIQGNFVKEADELVIFDKEKHNGQERYSKQYLKRTLDECILNFIDNTYFKLLVARVTPTLFSKDKGSIVASLQEFVYQNNKEKEENKRTILIITSNHFETVGLEHICEYLSLPQPSKKDIQGILGYTITKDEEGKVMIAGEGNSLYPFAADFKIDFINHYDALVDALYGMYRFDIVELLNTIKSESPFNDIWYYFKKGKTLPVIIKEAKKQMVKNSGLLEVIDYEADADKEVADIDNLSEYLEMERELINNQEFLKSKLPKPKGILLVGAPGCGKSASAIAAASILKLDLYRLNIGDLLGHKYGQSENRFIEALRTADASAPCVLWIDEIEKAFAGAGNESENDKTLTHIIGHFLTWMQEHKTMVYLVATANDLSRMKPEMLRKGRWDEIFYLVYPSTKEGREKIFDTCLSKYKLDEQNFPVDEAKSYIAKMDKMSGADISNFVVNVAKYYLLHKSQDNVDFKNYFDGLVHSADTITYESYKAKIEKYKKSNYKPASKQKK